MNKKNQQDEIFLSLDFEHLLSYLAGKVNNHGVTGYKGANEWLTHIAWFTHKNKKNRLITAVFINN